MGQLLNNQSGLGGASLPVDYEEVVQNVGAVAFEGEYFPWPASHLVLKNRLYRRR